VLLLLNEHGDPSFLFQYLSSYNINRQSFTKISVQVLFQWNDLKSPSSQLSLRFRHLLFVLPTNLRDCKQGNLKAHFNTFKDTRSTFHGILAHKHRSLSWYVFGNEQFPIAVVWKDELYRVNQREFWYVFLTEWSVPYLDVFHIWKRYSNL